MNTVARVGPAVADLKRRIPILKRLIADCDRLAADLDQEVRNEEDRVRIHDPANSAYSAYARATALRRDNLRRSALSRRSREPKQILRVKRHFPGTRQHTPKIKSPSQAEVPTGAEGAFAIDEAA
jgi:hypothetical protein